MFAFNAALLANPELQPDGEIDRLLKQLKAAKQCQWGSCRRKLQKEDEFLVELCRELLIPLFGGVVLEKKYASKVDDLAGASALYNIPHTFQTTHNDDIHWYLPKLCAQESLCQLSSNTP